VTAVFLFVLLVLSFGGALVSGLVGVGGAIVMLPLLLYGPPVLGVGRLDVKTVAAVTMVQVFVAAGSGFLAHRRGRTVQSDLALPLKRLLDGAIFDRPQLSGCSPAFSDRRSHVEQLRRSQQASDLFGTVRDHVDLPTPRDGMGSALAGNDGQSTAAGSIDDYQIDGTARNK